MSDDLTNPMIKHMAYNKFIDRTLTHVYEKIKEEHELDLGDSQKDFVEDHSKMLIEMCMNVFEKYEGIKLKDIDKTAKYLDELIWLIMDLVAVNGVNAALAAYYKDKGEQ